MIYDYACTNCENIQEEECSVNTFKEYRPKCSECGSECEYKFTATVVQFALKDGPSGSWPSKGEHFKKYRANRSEEMKRRQKDRYGHLKRDIVPNYDGKETGSWAEAQFQALKERGAESAATYKEKVSEEKDKKIV